jgi:DNA-binding GntR family transcriptional regulator
VADRAPDTEVEGEACGSSEPPDELMRRQMLGDQIKDQLLTWIIEGDLAPGDRVVETRIARDMGISQGPVREALRDLATLGVIDLRPYRGAVVRQPTTDELLEAIRVRAELERMAAREAAQRMTGDCLAELRRLCDEMYRLALDGDVHGEAIKNTEFHATIVRASGNRTLERMWLLLQPFARTYLTLATKGAEADREMGRHEALIEALESGDPERAAEVMWAHAKEAEAAVPRNDERQQEGT